MRLIALTGLAGTGKTAMLAELAAAGEDVVDLERLAAHRGSAYGRINIVEPQPSTAAFQAAVAAALSGCRPDRPIWIEDEGPFIGSVSLPTHLVTALRAAETVALTAPLEERVRRLHDTYVGADPQPLIDATLRIRTRLGPSRTERVVDSFASGHAEAAIRVLLGYFDHGYAHRARDDHRRRAVAAAHLVADLGARI